MNYDDVFTKEFRVKQFSDVIESLAAAMFIKCGLHGAQVFLKGIGILENNNEYARTFLLLVQDLEEQNIEEYTKKLDVRKIEQILGYEFKLK